MDRIRDLLLYTNNRWIFRTHALTSTLKRGQWHEFDTRLLHSAFDAFVDFVEIEQAWMHVACPNEEQNKYKIPWYCSFFYIGSWRSPEAGLAYLQWAAGLKSEEEGGDEYGKPTFQALAAQETIALYKWWKDDRPKRPDPMEASGWSAYCEKRREAADARGDTYSWDIFSKNETDEDRERLEKTHDLCHKMEIEQENEDTEMLIRLIKLRAYLWT